MSLSGSSLRPGAFRCRSIVLVIAFIAPLPLPLVPLHGELVSIDQDRGLADGKRLMIS